MHIFCFIVSFTPNFSQIPIMRIISYQCILFKKGRMIDLLHQFEGFDEKKSRGFDSVFAYLLIYLFSYSYLLVSILPCFFTYFFAYLLGYVIFLYLSPSAKAFAVDITFLIATFIDLQIFVIVCERDRCIRQGSLFYQNYLTLFRMGMSQKSLLPVFPL